MTYRTSTLRALLTASALSTLVLAGCATVDDVDDETGEDEVVAQQSEAARANVKSKGETCCAICNNRLTGKDIGAGDNCRGRAVAYCAEKDRGGLYDAQWGKTCGR